MSITQRPFENEQDKYRMASLALRFPDRHLHVVDLPYRLSSWALDDPENANLWFDERRVALSEGLTCLQSLGARDIYVETDNYRNTAFRLYQSFDFEVIQDVLVFRKDHEAA